MIFITKDIVKSSYTVSAGILVQIARYLTFLNADIEDFLRSVDIEPVIMESPDERISVEKYINIEDEAARITNDPYFGLHMGQFVEAGNWSILGYMMMNCKTLGEAFGKFAKYSNILGNLIKEDIHTESGISIYLTVPQNAPVISRHCYEGYLSSIICIARTLSGRNVNPVEVGLMFEEPENTDEYKKVFGCPVLFGQKQNYMTMDTEIISVPVLLPNENLLKYFESYASEFLSGVDLEKSLTYKVKKLILSYIDNEKLSVKFVSRELSMSVRSLQSNLKDEGTEFSKLLKETRIQLAKKYLKENYTIEDITYLLGFLDSSAFRKAFKKWVGVTPKEYRKIS